MHRAEFGQAYGQVPVASLGRLVDQNVAGTIHRLEHIFFLAHRQCVHMLSEEVVVPRGFPEITLGDLWSVHELVSPSLQLLSQEFLSQGPHLGAARMPENDSWSHRILNREQVQFPSQPSMVAPARLLLRDQKILEFRFSEKGGPVNSLQLLPLLVTLPVGTRNRQKLEDLKLISTDHVGTGTKIHKLPQFVLRQDFSPPLFDQFCLQFLPARAEETDGLLVRNDRRFEAKTLLL